MTIKELKAAIKDLPDELIVKIPFVRNYDHIDWDPVGVLSVQEDIFTKQKEVHLQT